MELAPANQPRHVFPRLKVFQTDNALRCLPLVIHAILLRRQVRKHAARSMTHAIRTTCYLTCIDSSVDSIVRCPAASTTHTPRALVRKTGRSLLGQGRGCSGVQCDALLYVLVTRRFVAVGTFGRKLYGANGTFVFLGNLTSWARRLGLRGLYSGRHVAEYGSAVVDRATHDRMAVTRRGLRCASYRTYVVALLVLVGSAGQWW